MILKQSKKIVDIKNLKQMYDKEYSFITELLEKVNLPIQDSDSSGNSFSHFFKMV